MASGRKPTARNRTGNVDKNAAGKNSAVTSLALPNIAALIADGEITVGVLRTIGCVATATDRHNCLAMRSGLAILNSAISGNSGQNGWPKKAGQEGVFDGQEIRAAHPPQAHCGV